jgi:hypothetical protein
MKSSAVQAQKDWLLKGFNGRRNRHFSLTLGLSQDYALELPTSRDELAPISTTDSLSIRDARIFFARSSAFVEKRIGQPSGAFAIG